MRPIPRVSATENSPIAGSHSVVARLFSAAEVAAVALAIAWLIWRGAELQNYFGALIAGYIVFSFVLRRDSPKSLGMRADNLVPATRNAAILFGTFSFMIVLTGLALHASPAPLQGLEWGRFLVYMSFCLLQQVALNSFLTNRLLAIFARDWIAAAFAGLIFAALHWPNPVLVPATFVGGTAMAWLFVRQRNILPLAVGQAILGELVAWAFPVAWHHMMRVGPGYYLPYRP